MKRTAVSFLAACVFIAIITPVSAKDIVRGSSIVKVGENVAVEKGEKVKDIVAIRGDVNVRGSVIDTVVAILGNIHLFPTAKVGGDVVSVGGSVVKHEGAVVEGDVVEVSGAMNGAMPFLAMASIAGAFAFKIAMFLGFLGLAAVIVAFLTRQVGIVASRIERNWWKELLFGVLWAVLMVPVAVLLAVTIVGIPLILVELLLVCFALILGNIAVAQIVGKKVLISAKRSNQPMMVEVLLGLFILFLVELIPVIGFMAKAVVLTMGLGAAVTTRLGTNK